MNMSVQEQEWMDETQKEIERACLSEKNGREERKRGKRGGERER